MCLIYRLYLRRSRPLRWACLVIERWRVAKLTVTDKLKIEYLILLLYQARMDPY